MFKVKEGGPPPNFGGLTTPYDLPTYPGTIFRSYGAGGAGTHTLSIPRIELKLHFVQNVEPDPREIGFAFHRAGRRAWTKEGVFQRSLLEDFMQSIITLSEAKAKFSELINRIIFKKETFVVTKKGRKVAVVIPVEKYRSEDSDGLIDAVGTLAEIDESIDDMVEKIYEARKTETDRKVEL